MAVATYTSDLALITLFESTTGISNYGGGGGAASAGIDYAIEGTNAVDKQVNATERGFLFTDAGGAWTIGADDHFYIWVCVGTYGLADTRDLRGICVAMGDDTSDFVQFHVNGGDTLPLGGMLPYAVRFVNTASTNLRTLVGTPGTSPDSIGCTANITGTARFANLAADACRFGTGYDILNGTGADPEANFAGIAADDLSTREGVLVEVGGGYSLQGKLRIGSASTACEFLDANGTILAADTIHSLTDFTEILVEHASSILTLTNYTFKALGTNNPGRLEMLTDTATLAMTGGGFIDWGVTVLGSASTVSGASWVGSARIDLNGADISTCNILTSSVAADEGAVFDDRTTTATTAIDELKGCTFSKGANDHHAIRFGIGVDDDISLENIEFTDFVQTEDHNGCALRFDATSGSLTCSLSGCTVNGAAASASNLFKDDAAGIAVTLVFDTVPLKVTVQDATTGSPLPDARVFLHKDGDDSTIYFEEECDTNGEVNDNIAYPGETDVVGWAREMNVSGTDYHPKNISGQITSAGLDILVQLEPLV